MKKSAFRKSMFQGLSSVAMCTAFLASGGVEAQTSQTAVGEDEVYSGEILVTARRKEENLLDTPVAIAAFSGDELAARNIVNLQDLSQSVPGANVVNQASNGGRSDRSFQAISLRGIAPTTGNLQTVSVFIDGVPVSSPVALQTITSPERIEIIKGPQSAYFGRQTFAGAINVVNKLPSEELTGSISGMVGTRANYDAIVELSGPILGEKLGFRVVARANGKHGSYKNYADPNTTLGNQTTKTGSLLLVAKPTENFTAKLFGFMVENKDGAPAQGLISATTIRDDSGALVSISQSNCVVNGNPFICGTAPKLSPYTPAQSIPTPSFLASLRNPAGRLIDPADGPQNLGLVSRTYHAHLGLDWEIGDTGLTVSSLTGYNKTWYSEVADSDNLGSTNFDAANAGGYGAFVLIDSVQRDYSQELRVTLENGGPFHATVGASYLDMKSQGSFGPNSGLRVNNGLLMNASGKSGARTFGAFFGLGYDISEKFSVNFDGRYQVDRIASYAGPAGTTISAGNAQILGVTPGRYEYDDKVVGAVYKNFAPRVIVQYKPNTDTMMYASYSKGINPGVFNTTLLTQRPEALPVAQANNIGVVVSPEKLDNYEVGFKGTTLDNKLTYQIAAFYALWTNQINQQQFRYTSGTPATEFSFVVSSNTGRTVLKGAEIDLGFRLARGLTLDLGGAYIDSEISNAANGPISNLTGLFGFKGNQTPLVSKWSGTAAVEYVTALIPQKNVDLIGRVDFTYKSGAYADISNLLKGPDVTNVNVTLGVQTERFSLQGFVTNLFNSEAYYSLITQTLSAPAAFTRTVPSGAYAQLRDLRTFGLKGSIKF
ncbi:TonB-dependent receptor [Sphingobium boeckii]|uniref:Iron complex outermembrane receptor protein n=1 Tax=Sphingobium boeckii TaxID=1082345 RepID=A0A7W9EG04_9SPHN|nr:TonB-dependent receptor [Sphingobium boeckii]MBB5686256.1 iron complex outermembrane receptor protein [Sphingobium boeckii]